MIKSAGKKLLVAMLAICAALTMIFGAMTYNRGEKIVANAEEGTTVGDLLDFSINCNGTSPNNFGGPLYSIKWKNANQPAAWTAIKAKIGDKTLGDYIVITNNSGESKTLNEWGVITRVVTWGGETGINLENAKLKKADVKSITLKAGLAPLVKGSNTDSWGNDGYANAYDTDSTQALPVDVTVYPNTAKGVWEIGSTALSVKTQPTTLSYLTDSTFDPTGMEVTATTASMGEINLDVNKLTYSYDFATAGQKSVTISYGGATTTVDVTVATPTKTLTGIEYKSGSVTIEQNGSASEMTLNDLKITVSYEGETAEDKTVTADMISVDPAELGVKKGKIIYTEGNVTKDCSVDVTVTARTSAFDKNNTYLIPIDGYYTGEDGGNLTLENSGINIWFTTNAGYGGHNIFDGLAEKWYSDSGFEAAFADVKAHVLLNGKTFDQLNAENAGLARYVLGYYAEGLSLRVHTDGTFKANNLETVTLLKGFRLYNKNAGVIGAPTPCDYTFVVMNKPGTSDKMLVRKTESLTVVNAPEKVEYTAGDNFLTAGMTVKAVYTDGGEKTFAVKDRMVENLVLNEVGEQDVTVTYNGKSVNQRVTVKAAVATVTGISVKSGAKLYLTQYSLAKELTPGAKLVVSYSDGETEEVDITDDMISGYTNATVGSAKAIVTYKEKTCEIDYTVNAYDGTPTLTGIKYGLSQDAGNQGGILAEFERTDGDNLKALWDIDKAQSAVFGKTNGDFVTINGVTVTELVKDGKVARMWAYGKAFGFHIDNESFMATVKNGAEICILPGFAWVSRSSDAWGADSAPATYVPIENAVVTKPMYFCFKNGSSAKVIESVEISGTPKTAYYKGDVIDVAGLTLSVKYKGLDVETVNLTADMCEYDFTSAGNKTVTVTYDGMSDSFDVTVEDVVLSGIDLDAEPAKKTYDFGIDNTLDLEGLVVKAQYSNNTVQEINHESLTVTGFDSRKFGVQTITVAYGDFSVTFEIEVKNISSGKYLGIDYASAATSYEATQHNSLVVTFTLNGVREELNSFWGAHNLTYISNYMLINGHKVSDLIAAGKVTRLAVWASQLVIHLDTIYLVPATWVDKRDADHPDALHYVEGTSEVVETVTFLPGFQWYTVNGILSGELWGNDNAYKDATPITGAVLKETITLHNEDGYGWTRPLKKNGDTIADDALTIVSLPTKTTYTVGERLELKGMQVLAKYEDGGEEILVPGASEIEGFKKDVAGTQTLTYTYFDKTVTFEVTVEEPKAEKKSGCGGSISAAGISGLGLLAFAFAFKKKRK